MVETNHDSHAFEAFFESWMIRQEQYLQQLLLCATEVKDNDNDERCNDLIKTVMTHYRQYYNAKAKVVEENVFLVLAPTWFSSFERAYLWIGGFKPGMAFRLVTNNVFDLTDVQSQSINSLMVEIKEEENQVMNEFTRIQEEMVSPTMVELAGQRGRLRNGGVRDLDAAVDRMKVSLEVLVECADFLRRKTVAMLLEMLKPNQAVRFLAAVSQLQLRLRRWGCRETCSTRGVRSASSEKSELEALPSYQN